MKRRLAERMISMLTVMMSLVCLCGCKSGVKLQSDMQNVEQRDYATILLVAQGKDGKSYEFSLGIAEEKKVGEKSQTEKISTFYADDFEELARTYQNVKGKSLSLVHLKTILLTKEQKGVLEEQGDIISQMGENEEIAKTCPVLQISDKDEFLQYIKDAKEPVGIYLSNIIKMKESQGDDVPWLKDYLKVLREEMDLPIYFLEKETEGWQLKCKAEVSISS